jgi:adenosylhomocysteine nucleosidase
MHEELSAVLALMPSARSVGVAGRQFWQAHWQGHQVVAVLSRIGKVAAATTATVLIERFGSERILFTGVAGGLGAGVQVGDLVVGSHFLQHDLDASPIFPRYEVPLYGCSSFAADVPLADCLQQAAQATLQDLSQWIGTEALAEFGLVRAGVHRGLIVSGDRFVSTSSEGRALQAALPNALAVEMEGAAVAQVCHDYGVPFAAVRSISDRADDAAHGDFTRFVQRVACHYSAAIVSQTLLRL